MNFHHNLVVNSGENKDHMRASRNASSPPKIYFLVDSWSFRKTIQSTVPSGKQLTLRNIIPKCRSQIRRFHMYFFGLFKAIITRIRGHVFTHSLHFKVHQRHNILKVISLIYHQLWPHCTSLLIYFSPTRPFWSTHWLFWHQIAVKIYL